MITVITGAPKSGKTEIATLLAATHGYPFVDSQVLRAQHEKPSGSKAGIDTFDFIRQRLRRAISAGHPLVVASSGMSWRLRWTLHDLRSSIFHVHLTIDFEAAQNKPRAAGGIENTDLAEAHARAQTTRFIDPPDLTIDTSAKTAHETVALIERALHCTQAA